MGLINIPASCTKVPPYIYRHLQQMSLTLRGVIPVVYVKISMWEDDTLHPPGMRPLNHQSDTTYSLPTLFHLMHIRYSLIMIDVEISTS